VARQSVLIEDFGGGLDLVSSLNNIPPGFTPNALNVRLAEYGGWEKTLGYSAFGTASDDLHELAYYAQKDGSPKRLIGATATNWYEYDDEGTETSIHTVTAATNTTFVTYEDKLYGLDVANNIAVWDGTGTATSYVPGVNTGPPQGIILGIWQNRMWVAKAVGGQLGMRVEFSEPADPTGGFVNATGLWPTDNYVELGGTSGQSERLIGGIVTSEGLLIFSTNSAYLIYDTDGKYRVVDGDRGCSSRHSLALIGENVHGITNDGVFVTNGSFPLEIISRRVDPLFRNESPDLSAAAGIRWGNAYLGSYQRLSASAGNDLTLDVTAGGEGIAIMANEYPALRWARANLQSDNVEELYFVDASDPTRIRRAFDGGSFAGADIRCFYDLPFDNFGNEATLKRLQRLRIVGRGDLRVSCRVDYQLASTGAQRTLTFPAAGDGVWNTMLWDDGTWGGYALFEGYVNPAVRGRRIQIRLSESSDEVFPMRDNLGASISGQLGGAGVYLCEPMFTTSSRRR
jgi:hypothetical protein